MAEAGEGYFETMRIPILRGRGFGDADRKDSSPVAVVNETFARTFWPAGEAVGRTLAREDETLTVVGVVRDGKYRKLSEAARPFLYAASGQSDRLRRELVVRGGGPPAALAAALRRELKAIDPAIPFPETMTIEKFIGFSTLPPAGGERGLGRPGDRGPRPRGDRPRRTRRRLGGAAHAEIGLRLAVGASPRDVLLMEVRRAGRLTAAGFGAGALAALLATPLLGQFLFGVKGADPMIFGAVGLILAATTLLASAIPARRAARLDPLQALSKRVRRFP